MNEQPVSVRLCAAQVGDTGVSTWSSAGRLLGVREDRKLQPAVADSVIRTTTAQLDREFGKRKACKPGPVTATWKANDRFVAVQIWGSDVQGLPIHLAVEQTVYPRRR